MERRLATILVADVSGFSRLMEIDEEGTAARMRDCLSMTQTEIAKTNGRLFKTMGDAILAEFSSPMNAMRCAISIRDTLASNEQYQAEPLKLRFGLHLADVMVEGEDLIGDGVNVAARIQQAAEPGEIFVSGSVFDQIRRTTPYSFRDLGKQNFKNISEAIRVYCVTGEAGSHRFQVAPTRLQPQTEKRPHSLAVLPLVTSSNDEDQQFLADGFTEDLVFELGRFRKLFITALSATRTLLESDKDPRRVGELLGVRYVLNGSIRKMGSRVRLSLTLTETDGGTVVWSERLNPGFEELLDGLEDVVSRIASTLLGRIEETDISAARRKKPESMNAYELHLRGLEHHRLGGVTDENYREAVKWFGRAIEADPSYARAQAMYTCSGANLSDFDLEEGIKRIERALESDPNEPEAHRIRASIFQYQGKFELARPHVEKALELSPNDPFIRAKSANFYSSCGEAKRSLEHLDAAERLDPFLPVWCVEERLIALYVLGRFEEAVDFGIKLPFQTRRSRIYRAASLVALDKLEAARAVITEALKAVPELTTEYVEMGEHYADRSVKDTLIDRLMRAGLPGASQSS
ncbi:adenylate/guanylate cyclase domain-containing protein [Marimonas sp. MJW-29]|uniref:Adenylate/guanylate cyclase domain-containing protein n=1 Tax=Sulfitobacter sediminis TaxID=3234186 RepID=A0ABV3RU25_9RHOB